MKKNTPSRLAFTVIAAFLLLNSCSKTIPANATFPDPLTGDDQVAEYHIPTFDAFFNTKFPNLFRKTYDPSGKILKEIVFSFTDDLTFSTILEYQLDLMVHQKGRIVFLIKKDSVQKAPSADTVARIYLNQKGRPDSCIGTGALDEDAEGHPAETEYYFYKDNRLQVVRNFLVDGGPIPTSGGDTIHYDKYGNPSSFGSNSYQYDYTRTAKQQFYCDDYMGGDDEFYLLQYLGYFPEVTSPPNIRTFVTQFDEGARFSLSNHQFDAQGRLISYAYFGSTPITITWNGH
jgi:hypothetical protein